MIWSEQRVECLRGLIGRGHSASQIAKEINRRFGTSYTRNAIVGVAHRRKIPWKHPAGGRAHSPKPRKAWKPTVVAPPLAPPEPAGQVAFMHCQLVHFTNVTCRWPVCDRPGVFCGSPTADLADGVPYCNKHSRLAYA